MRDTAPQGTYKVQALDRAFAVLDLLGESEVPLGLAQVASSLQLHKSTAHRFLMVLERHRMVERTTNGKFRLGLRLFDFGNRAIEQYDLARARATASAPPGGRNRRDRAPLHSRTGARDLHRQDRAGTFSAHDYAHRLQQSRALHIGGQGDAGLSSRGPDQRHHSTHAI